MYYINDFSIFIESGKKIEKKHIDLSFVSFEVKKFVK